MLVRVSCTWHFPLLAETNASGGLVKLIYQGPLRVYFVCVSWMTCIENLKNGTHFKVPNVGLVVNRSPRAPGGRTDCESVVILAY